MSSSGPGDLINGDQGIKTNTTVVTDLLPDTKYFAQVAAAGARERTDGQPGYYKNSYSPALEFTTISDDTAPASPTITHAGFDDEGTFRVEWSEVTHNEDGSSLTKTKDFRDYTVTFFPTGSPENIKEYSTTDKKFELPLPLNRLLFLNPITDLTVEVRARDLAYNESAPATASDSIAALAAPEWDEGAISGPLSIRLSWHRVQGASFYEVWRGTSSGFSLGSGKFVSSYTEPGTGSINFYTIPPTNDVYHYRIVARNIFGVASPPSTSRSASAESPINDEDIEYVMGAPVISVDATKGHQFTLTHSLQDAGGAEVAPNFLVVYAGPTGTEDRLASIPVPREEDGSLPASVSGSFTYVVANSTTSIRATVVPANAQGREFEDGRSAASNAVTIPQAGATYIANAAITDAHIQDLSASKLKAGTAIINDLGIESQLTVAAGGLLKSDNFSSTSEIGWAISSTGYAEFNNVKIRGTVQATAGFLQDLNVIGMITVGSGTTSGTIRSTTSITSTNGWAIYSNGSVVANNISARGYIDATSGYLGSLTVTGNIVVGQSSGGGQIQSYTQSSTSGWSISRTGFAMFNNIQAKGYIDAESGYLRNLTVYGLITVGTSGSGGTIRSSNYSTSGGWQLLSSGSFTSYNGNMYLNGTSGARIRVYSSGIYGWNTGSSQTFAISATSGNAVFYSGTFMGTLSSATFTSGLVTASTFQTRSSGARVVITGNSNELLFYGSDGTWSRLSQGNSWGLETSHSVRIGGANATGTLYCSATTYVNSTRNWRWRASGDYMNLDQSPTSSTSLSVGYQFAWGTTGFLRCVSDGGANLGTSTGRWRDVWAVDTTINSSDEDLKDEMNESPVLGMNLVEALPAMSFKWKTGSRRHYGWSAQKLRSKLDALGVSTADFAGFVDPSINPDDPEGYQERVAKGDPPGLAIRPGELTAVLWTAVRELNERVKELEAAAAV